MKTRREFLMFAAKVLTVATVSIKAPAVLAKSLVEDPSDKMFFECMKVQPMPPEAGLIFSLDSPNPDAVSKHYVDQKCIEEYWTKNYDHTNGKEFWEKHTKELKWEGPMFDPRHELFVQLNKSVM